MAAPSTPDQRQSEPAPKRKVGWPGILLRLLLAGLVGTILGAVIYFTAMGWIPYLDNRIFQPLDKNQLEISALYSTQEALNLQIQTLEDSLSAYQATLEGYSLEMTQLNEDDLSLQATLDNNTVYLLLQTQALATLEAQQGNADRNLSALATSQMSLAGSQQRIDLLLIIDRLSRVQQFLLHANYGLAESELGSAQTDLEDLAANAYGYQKAVLKDLSDLVTQMIADLPANPDLAENKLELAWQLAVQGFPELFGAGTLTPTPYQTPSLTITPTPRAD